MNEYSLDLFRAKAKQRRLYLITVVSVGSIFLALFISIWLMRVTLVEITPGAAAEKAAINIQEGVGFSMGTKVYTFSSDPTLKISAVGFAAEIVEIQRTHEGVLRVELQELPGKLQVDTNSDNDGTRWLLDGQLISVGRALKVELKPGSYSLEINSLYHEKRIIDVSLGRGEEKRYFVDLSPVQGQIDIASVPNGLPVKINGVAKGVTPVSGPYKGGIYTVEIEAPDYEIISDEIKITNESSRALRNYQLEPKKAYLKFDLVPAGGELILNGNKVEDALRVAIKAARPNTVTYLKNGYFLESRRLILGPGEVRNISFRLRAELGKVEINSSPASEVSINGKPHGKTPLLISLLAVKQRITLSKKGYRSVSKSLTPSSKTTKKFSATLQQERVARLAEAKAKYKNSIGMEFKLFKPSRIEMGAARHEKGQRANEFERSVDLKKPFYVSLREVTINQFSRFRKTSGSAPSGNYPVTSISWLDAAAFCNWLSSREKISPFYVIRGGKLVGINRVSDGYRLPSEAEWEWLARKAGRKNQTRFTWGDEFVIPPASGNIADEAAKNSVNTFVPNYTDGYARLAPVGTFMPDQAGLYDLTGNVSEWVHDYYSLIPPRKGSQKTDPLGEETGANHVVKGSNWKSGSLTELRASFREGAVNGGDDIGFRVARYLYGAEENDN